MVGNLIGPKVWWTLVVLKENLSLYKKLPSSIFQVSNNVFGSIILVLNLKTLFSARGDAVTWKPDNIKRDNKVDLHRFNSTVKKIRKYFKDNDMPDLVSHINYKKGDNYNLYKMEDTIKRKEIMKNNPK